MPVRPLTFASPTLLCIAAGLLLVTVIVTALRRPALPGLTKALGGLGLILLCLAAGGMTWRRPLAREVVVMVDLSPSTRSAAYRDRARLEARAKELLGNVPYRLVFFADGIQPDVSTNTAALPDLPADRTVFAPASAAPAVLLFSDGRFDAPPPSVATPPVYPVTDLGLRGAADAAVANLEPRGVAAAVTVRNSGPPRTLTVNGARGPSPTTMPSGSYVVTRPIDAQAGGISAALSAGDLWPENDALSAPLPPPAQAERWIVSSGPTPTGAEWRRFAPGELPTDPAAYLAPAVIVLDNLSAVDLTPLQQDRLRQYVRNLGGGLVILGGDHAFAAGGYAGSVLEALSPLACTPPLPTTHWMLLADGSGSMNAPAGEGAGGVGGGPTRWQYAADALVRVLPALPPDDLVSVGSFADAVTWWIAGRSAREVAALPLPPAGATPRGPTNLRPALDSIAERADPALPKQLLVLTDGDAEMGDPSSLIAALKAKNIRLHLLALGDGRGLPALRQVVEGTGGRFVQQADAPKWAQVVQELMRAAGPTFLESAPLTVKFTGPLASLGQHDVVPWNRTWLKRDAAALAEAAAGGETLHPVARWSVGEGSVLAAAFAPAAGEREAFAATVGRPPRDPRFRVTWDAGPRLRVTVDAVEGGKFLNDRKLTLERTPDRAGSGSGSGASGAESIPMPQVSPGRYELLLPASRSAGFAAVRVEGSAIDRIAVPTRYAPEFDEIGEDFEALSRLAHRTGGRMVGPSETKPIEFAWPPRDLPLTPWLASAGALLVAGGLIWWRAR